MKEQILEIAEKLRLELITEYEAQNLLFGLFSVIQRSEQLVAFVKWLEANSDHSIDRGWIEEYIEATNCV